MKALKTSIQYSTWKICSQVGENYGVKFSKEFVSTLGTLGFEQTGIFAEDLESFAKHAKRATINCDDVKLLVRRIPNLKELVDEISPKNAKPKKKDDKRKIVDVEDSKDEDNATSSKIKKGPKRKRSAMDETSSS